MDHSKTLAGRITECLVEKQMTSAALARACGVAGPSVTGWTRGTTKNLRGEHLAKLSAIFGVNPLWLASGSGPKRGPPDNVPAHASPAPYAVEPWPFAIAYSRFKALPDLQKGRIGGFIESVVTEWETTHRVRSRKPHAA